MNSNRIVHALLASSAVAVACAALAPSVAAQDTLFTLEGENAGDKLGYRVGVAVLDDMDGDGCADFVGSDPYFDGIAGSDCGRVRLFSGRTRAVLREWQGEGADENFGYIARRFSDWDGDGLADFAISAIGHPTGAWTGKVYIYSSATGAELGSFVGENPLDQFGSMRDVGDATGDGVADMVVTAFAFGRNGGTYGQGKVYLYSGADGSLFNSWVGAVGDEIGFRNAALGFDVDGDGLNDFAAGSPEFLSGAYGRVDIFSAHQSTPVKTLRGTIAGAEHTFVVNTGDIDGDGTLDLPICSPFANGGYGELTVYSGATWSVLRSWSGSAEFDISSTFHMVGDVDGDGHDEMLQCDSGFDGAAGVNSGAARLMSGANGRELTRFFGAQSNGLFGSLAVSGDGDLDGDGRRDLLMAETHLDGAAGVDCGKLYCFQGNDLYLNLSHEVAYANDTVTATTTAGIPGNIAILVLTELDGTPLFEVLTPYLTFDSNGELIVDSDIDSSVGVHDLKVQSWAIGRNKKLIQSSERTLLLR